MSGLSSLQEWLCWAWTDPRGLETALAIPSPNRPEPSRQLDEIVSGAPGALRRLGVYANAYFERILGAMAGDFPALKAVLGETDFRRLTAEYLATHPSRTYNIDDIGHALPAFLRGHPLTIHRPYLEDLARLEREIFLCLYTDRETPMDAKTLSAIPPDSWPTLQFTITPDLRWLPVMWPVVQLWRKRKGPDPTHRISFVRHPAWVVLWWDEEGLHVQSMDADEIKILQWIKGGISLGETIRRMETLSPLPLQEWCAGWIQRGWVTGVRQAPVRAP